MFVPANTFGNILTSKLSVPHEIPFSELAAFYSGVVLIYFRLRVKSSVLLFLCSDI